jgi:hypothetical protein
MLRCGHRVDPYLEIPMPMLMKGWQKKWFYLNNDAFALLLEFTDRHPIPLPPESTTPEAEDQDVGISIAKLPNCPSSEN